MHISLRAGDKIYINGAVLKCDRKVNIELLNDVTFLLEAHVMLAKDADTPLKQLYFVIQTLLIDPSSADTVQPLLERMFASLRASFENAQVLAGLATIEAQAAAGRAFDALKTLRALYPTEAQIIAKQSSATTVAA